METSKKPFNLVAPFEPQGDQPSAIQEMVDNLKKGMKQQTLLGITGSGKTFSIAHVIQQIQKPTLVISHNKTLAAQLFLEFKEFFPENAVAYFVSYYDYYMPESYIPSTDTYIEKETDVNEEIDRMRHSACYMLTERNDVIVVASVSCIYGIGSPEDYRSQGILLQKGMYFTREQLIARLIEILFERNDFDFYHGRFRVRGDIVEIFPAHEGPPLRVEFFGEAIERISEFHPITGKTERVIDSVFIPPASIFITPPERLEAAIKRIEKELEQRLDVLRRNNKLLEAQRLEQRTRYDLEMIQEVGFCTGIENYSAPLQGRKSGEPPQTLIDFFCSKGDFLLVIDESHQTIPQIRGMYEGDRSRKQTLVDHGFRLPSALDNRPLKFKEFEERLSKFAQTLYVSATPSSYELEHSSQVVEQIIRPTGLVDPEITVRSTQNQIDDLLKEIKDHASRNERILVTTLTKRMAEDLTDYLKGLDVRVQYLHSEVHTLDRVGILRNLRTGEFDVLVGINLLREGLDLPEVALVAILDADKEGFLRSETALIQTIGRTARHVDGKVIMYADRITDSMQKAIVETNRRRLKQLQFNEEHGITPRGIVKPIMSSLQDETKPPKDQPTVPDLEEISDLDEFITQLEKEMKEAAANLDFERAANLRDQIKELIAGNR
ncbi:MAG: excinuclease ABC subunit UvrB [Candidatus Hermodarchaeota archaeon]